MTPGDHVPGLCAITYDVMFNSRPAPVDCILDFLISDRFRTDAFPDLLLKCAKASHGSLDCGETRLVIGQGAWFGNLPHSN